MILSLTPASSTSFKTTAATFSASRIRVAGTPEELGVIFPVEEDGDAAPPYRQRGTGGFFPSQCRTTSQVSPGFPQFHDLLGDLLSPRNSCSMDRALRDRHTPNVHSKNLSDDSWILPLPAIHRHHRFQYPRPSPVAAYTEALASG
ncbi:hypothetical protein GWK47_023128 [Chionoecetes opilio]|uniref:Uncharacterized protein n=1 Tax=Chionoecetes opilio TaxID=41210 RepID=A0A8J5CEW2_CHIOP|nr:hypothetical protein GWK47_023128 [Chionoecetes opilio]